MTSKMNEDRQRSKKDLGLLIPLVVLNLVSGWTTIRGAEIALGNQGIAVMAGISIQGILFILLSGMAANHAPVRKWIAIAVFSLFSIYTSFFTYYGQFATTDQMVGANFRNAEQAHEQLVTLAVKPLQEEFNRLQAKDLTLEQAIKTEEGGGGITGIPGRGPETRRLIEQRNNLAPKLNELKLSTGEIEKLLEQANSLQSNNPDDLLRISKEIWEAVPLAYRPTDYEGPKRDEYFDSASRFELLAPLLHLTEQQQSNQNETPSTAALVLASVIDGMGIMLGTAIDQRARRAPFEGVASFFGQIIWGAKSARRTLQYYWWQPGRRYMNTTPAQSTMAREAVYLVKLRLSGRGSHFLEKFLDAVEPVGREIDYDQLMQHSNMTFRTGFRLLLEAFRHPSLNWINVQHSPVNWAFIDADSYYEFHKWLSEEIIYQAERENEEGAGLSEEETETPKVIQFRRPQAA